MRAWLVIALPLWIVLALCCAWEPIVHDSWGHVHWHATTPLDREHLWLFVSGNYRHNNPRFGQIITLLLFAPGPWHVVVTPVAELGVFWLMTVLALGRVPRLRSRDDALAFLVVTAMAVATMPVSGQMLFYRPYSGNYVYAWGVNLLLLVPYRLSRRWPVWFALPMLALGFVAGWCNEHTGIAVGLLMAAAIVAARPLRSQAPWMVAGLVGLVAGYVFLLVAPAQHVRYNGLADQASALEVIATRGLGNATRVGIWLLHLGAALPWMIASARTRPPRLTWVALAGAFVIVLTLLASPKQGERLLFAPTTLAAIGLSIWVLAHGVGRVAIGYAIAVLAFTGVVCVVTYREAGLANARRVELVTGSPAGARVVIPRLPDLSYWTIGEDLEDPARREALAKEWGLGGIELE